MANYYAFIRTNYFSVTDEEAFRKLIASVSAEDEVSVFEEKQPDGRKKFGFGLCGSIYGLHENGDDEEPSIGALESALQRLLVPGDAIIIIEIGYEKLRYLIGISTIITQADIRYIDLRDRSLKAAKRMLKNPKFQTQMEY